MIDLDCCIPSTWDGELGYTAPQATRSIDDIAVVVADVPREKFAGVRNRHVSAEMVAIVRGELWTTERLSREVWGSLRKAGHEMSHRQVCAALEKLRERGVAVRRVCNDKDRQARWTWRLNVKG